MRFLQLAKMTESPSDLVAVAFRMITVALACSAQNFGNVFAHTGSSLRYIQSCVSLLHYSGEQKDSVFCRKNAGKAFRFASGYKDVWGLGIRIVYAVVSIVKKRPEASSFLSFLLFLHRFNVKKCVYEKKSASRYFKAVLIALFAVSLGVEMVSAAGFPSVKDLYGRYNFSGECS